MACGLAVTAVPAQAVWIDEFDNGDPLTNSTPTGWTNHINGAPTPILAEPGRDGDGTLELAYSNKGGIVTSSPLAELDFFSGPTRVTFADFNSWVYQSSNTNGDNKTLGGGTSLANTYLFVSAYSQPGLPRDGSNTGDGFELWHSNGGTLNLRIWQNFAQVGGTQTIFGVGFNSTKYDIILDIDPTNYTLEVFDAASDGLIGSLSGVHGLTEANWSAAAPGANVGMLAFAATVGNPPFARYATLSVGSVTAQAIPEPTAIGLAAAGGMLLLLRRQRTTGGC